MRLEEAMNKARRWSGNIRRKVKAEIQHRREQDEQRRADAFARWNAQTPARRYADD